MASTLIVAKADSLVPFDNQALEEYLLDTLPDDAVILYLWRNKNTVVVGKNQCCFRECKVAELESDGGFLARRLSGGGAVYHDGNNLNFSFIARERDYDVKKQLAAVCRAVGFFGIDARISGRNDLEIGGRKFSGNAFYSRGDRKLHHGTILIDTDAERLARYLTVSESKLSAKGVPSVRARVVNLASLCNNIDEAGMSKALVSAVSEGFSFVDRIQVSRDEYAAYITRFACDAWRYGEKPMTAVAQQRFVWGDFRLELTVADGRVANAAVYSDSLDYETFPAIGAALKGAFFSAEELCRRVRGLNNTENSQIIGDVTECLKNNID